MIWGYYIGGWRELQGAGKSGLVWAIHPPARHLRFPALQGLGQNFSIEIYIDSSIYVYVTYFTAYDMVKSRKYVTFT